MLCRWEKLQTLCSTRSHDFTKSCHRPSKSCDRANRAIGILLCDLERARINSYQPGHTSCLRSSTVHQWSGSQYDGMIPSTESHCNRIAHHDGTITIAHHDGTITIASGLPMVQSIHTCCIAYTVSGLWHRLISYMYVTLCKYLKSYHRGVRLKSYHRDVRLNRGEEANWVGGLI